MTAAAEPSSVGPGWIGPERHDAPKDGRSCFAVVDGRQVHYLEWGGLRRPAVVCLHGGGQTAYMYEEIGAALASTHLVIAPDLPAHGESDPPAASRLERQVLAAWVLPLLEHLGLDSVVLIGASLGGITSLTLAASRPDLVAGIVLIDIGHDLEEAGVQRVMDFLTKHESFGSLAEAAAAVEEYVEGRRKVVPESLRRNLRQRPDGRWAWKHGFVQGPLSDVGDDWREGILQGLDDDARTIQAPTLVLRGAESDVLSASSAQELVRLLPRGELGVVSAAGHLAVGDNPAGTVALIQEFLARIGW